MSTRTLVRIAAVPALAIALVGTAMHADAKAAAPPASRSAAVMGHTTGAWKPRPAQYPGTASRTDLKIPMDDGTVLRGDLTLPADASGRAVPRRFPVVVTITAYNKSAQGPTGLAGGDASYLVRRGYAQLTVDARGTGSSQGTWCAFCTREDKDAGEVLQWAHQQPWSNGRTAMTGPSYMGIDQIFAAADHPDGLRAIFPQVPAADVYRDVVASGGQLDVGFIPLWLGLVTVTGVIPPAYLASDPTSALGFLTDRLSSGGDFTLPTLLGAMAGSDTAYDGPFYAQRSPINVIDKVRVPTFLVSGEFDLFQRGTPLLFERLQRHHVPVKMIIGPWNHLQGSAGTDIGQAGYGSLSELQLRWFDHYVKGRPDPGLGKDIAPVSYYEQGSGRWRHTRSWVGRDRRAVSFRLSGSSTAGATDGRLTRGRVVPGSSAVYPAPVSGLCTRSTDQWTAGVPSEVPVANPCFDDNQWNDRTGAVFQTAPLGRALRFQGPINAHLFVSSDSGDGMLAVSVEDVAPNGKVRRLTAGWQVISLRRLDRARSRYLDGQLLQPYHPFTKASQHRLLRGQVAPVDVEVFPTGASIRPGHRLRLAVQAYDVPHLLPTLPGTPGTLTVMTLHDSAAYPSRVTLPVVR
jgi:putative CocE/NonD family hydrolase